jgi:hypothetical protein
MGKAKQVLTLSQLSSLSACIASQPRLLIRTSRERSACRTTHSLQTVAQPEQNRGAKDAIDGTAKE